MNRTLRRLQIQKLQYTTAIMQAEDDLDTLHDSINRRQEQIEATKAQLATTQEQIEKCIKEEDSG